MNHCVRLLLLFTPSLIALGLLGIAFSTNWWTIALEHNIPKETSFHISDDGNRIHSLLIRIPVSRGLLTECIAYRNVKVLVSNSTDFRSETVHDEKLANENCTSNQFTCKEGFAIAHPLTRCIDSRQQCNRIIDCEDRSDEMNCSESANLRDNEFFQCPNEFVKCPDGKTCYRQTEQTCDGVSNCMDDSDEKNCDAGKCQQNNHVYCPRENKCARRVNSKRCDGIVDCADFSDEEKCERCSYPLLSCDSKCLPAEYRCDGIGHCSNLIDEENCGDQTSSVSNHPKRIMYKNQTCLEHRFHPFRFSPPQVQSSSLKSYSNPGQRIEHLHLLFYLQSIVFYGIVGGLIFLLLAVVSLFFFGCCRRHCISVPFYFYGFWMLLAWLLIVIALVSFVFIWLWQKQTVLDKDKSIAAEIQIHERNPTLRHIEFFGLSFWLACGAALSAFIGLLLSYCVCCTVGSSRSDDKEYEIMQMHNY